MSKIFDSSSNEIWENAANFASFENTRPLLFRDDMREQFFRWFRIKPSDNVLDGGCASGVLTRFIAKGLNTGFITGFDISQHFVDFGNQKISEEGLSGKAKIIKEDGYALSFADNSFDAVINHTYIGVLSDVVAGMNELVRVCKPGGFVSASCSGRRGFTKVHWAGDNPFPGEARLMELENKRETAWQGIYNADTLKQDDYWNIMRYPRLFSKCGLENITIHPYASGFSYNDSYWTDEFKKNRIQAGIGYETEMSIEQRNDPAFAEHDFMPADYDELIELYRQKKEYLLSNLQNDECWEWEANMHLIVTGMKI